MARSTVVAVPRGYNAMIALQGPRSDRRQWRRIAAIFGAGVAALLASFPFDVEAASCGSYPKDIRAAIKKHVETLRALARDDRPPQGPRYANVRLSRRSSARRDRRDCGQGRAGGGGGAQPMPRVDSAGAARVRRGGASAGQLDR